MQKIYSTYDYTLFESHESNRDLDIRMIEESMEKFGWLDPYPMYVVKNGGKTLKIKDGHHRFAAAMRLGLPIKYVVESDRGVTMPIIDGAHRPWSVKDYLSYYVRQGIKDYIVVKKYCDETGITVTAAISMHAGDSARSANHGKLFKKGAFKVKNVSHPADVAKVVLYCKKIGVPFASTYQFVTALSKILQVKQIFPGALMKKIKQGHKYMEKQTSIDGYVAMLERIYNNRNKNKLPVAFLADEAAKDRSPFKR